MKRRLPASAWIALALVLGIGILVAGSIVKDRVAARIVSDVVQARTGFGLTLQSVDANLWKSTIEVRGLLLKNPPAYPDEEALAIDELLIDYDWRSLWSDRLHITDMVVDIPLVVLVTKEDGDSNLQELSENMRRRIAGKRAAAESGSSDGPEAAAPSGSQQPSPPPVDGPEQSLRIDRLHLAIGKAEIRDYAYLKNPDGSPMVQTMDVNYEDTFVNIENADDLTDQVSRSVMNRLLPQLLGNQMNQLFKSLEEGETSEIQKRIESMEKEDLDRAVDTLEKQLNSLFDQL